MSKPSNKVWGISTTEQTCFGQQIGIGEFEVNVEGDLTIYNPFYAAYKNGYDYFDYEELYFDIDTSTITNGNFDNAFSWGTVKLKKLSFVNFDTLVINNMKSMFSYNHSLTALNLGRNFDTSNVTNMVYMFRNCNSLTTLNLGAKFDTYNVTSMGSMFNGCSSLTTVTGTITGITQDLDLHSMSLTKESAMVFINGLASGVTGKTLTLNSSTYNALSPDQRKVATDKGWTLASK